MKDATRRERTDWWKEKETHGYLQKTPHKDDFMDISKRMDG